ncbi:MAG: transglutaminase domain-containing protein [Clostridia bacterium]|nr:transglutaminase domain-containing protein [Clostridia bacterium]
MKRETVPQLNQVTGLAVERPRATPGKESPLANAVWGFLLTCLGEGCAVLAFVTAFRLPGTVWLPLCAALLFPAFFTSLFFLRHALVPGFLISGAAWLCLIWRFRAAAWLGLLKTSSLMIEQFTAHSAWTFVDLGPDIANMAGTLAERRVTLFLLLALFPWAALFTWAVVRRHSFFLSFALTLPFVAVPLWFYIQPGFPPLMGLLLFWGAMAFARLVPKGDRGAAGRVALYSLPALTLCLVLLNALAPMEGYQRSAQMEGLRLKAEAWARSLPGLVMTAGQNLPSGPGKGFLSYDQNRRSFDGLDATRFTGQTALRIKVAGGGSGALYLKGFTGGVYTESGWERLGDEAEAALAEACAPVHPQNLTAYCFEDILESSTVTVINQANPKAVYVPPRLVTTPELFALAEFIGDGNIRAKGLLGLNEYTVKYLPQINMIGDISLGGAEEFARYGEAARQYYTEVPEELAPILDAVLSEAHPGGRVTPSGAAAAVEQYLEELGSYTLTPGPVPEGRDFTEYFLTENQKGFCVHFATAGVLLMRALGIPARYCEGYLATPSDQRLKGSDGYSNVSDRRAHAWVEYWRDGVGWTTMECTPGFNPQDDLVQPNDSANEEPAPATPAPTVPPTPPLTPAVSAAPTPAPGGKEEDKAAETALAVLKGLVWPALAALAVYLRRKIVLRLRRGAFTQADANRAALEIYAMSARLTPYAGPMNKEATGLAERARFSQHVLEPEELQKLRDDWSARQKKALEGSNALTRLWLLWGLCLEKTPNAEGPQA